MTAGFPYYDPYYGGGDETNTYIYWLKKELIKNKVKNDHNFDNKGICGQTTSEIVYRLTKELQTMEYELVILWGGTNDLAMNLPVRRVFKNLNHGSDLIIGSKKDGILLNVPPTNWSELNGGIIQLNEMISSSIAKSITIVDVFAILEKNGKLKREYDSGDGAHLNQNAYKVIGKELGKYF